MRSSHRFTSPIEDSYKAQDNKRSIIRIDLFRNYWWVLLWAGLFIFHAVHLRAPTWDVPYLADYAMHGRVLMKAFLHPPGLSYRYKNDDFGDKTGLLWVLRQSMERFGIGIVPLRIPALIASQAALLILLWAARRTRLPNACLISLLLFGTTHLFFMTTHSARPEAELFLATAANFAWLILEGGRLASLLVGFLATIVLIFHPGAIFLCASMPLLIISKGKQGWISPASAWWLIGALAGGLIAINNFDITQAVVSLRLDYFLVGSSHVKPMPLLAWKTDLMGMLMHLLSLLGRPLIFSPVNHCDHLFFYCAMIAIVWQIRRWRSLSPPNRSLLLFTVVYLTAYGLLTGSENGLYNLYLHPWLWLNAFLVATALWKREMALDSNDYVLATAMLAVLLSLFSDVRAMFIVDVLLLRILTGHREKKVFNILLIGIFAVFVLNFDWLIQTAFYMRYLVQFRPWFLMSILTVPWLATKVSPRGLELRQFNIGLPARLIAAAFAILVCFRLVIDLRSNISEIQNSRSSSFQMLLSKLRRQTRIIGPGELWLYAPMIPFQDTDEIFNCKRFRFPVNLAERFMRYRPSYILIQKDGLQLLRDDATKIGIPMEEGDQWPPPILETNQPFVEVRLLRTPKARAH